MYIDCESVYSPSSAVKQTSETLRKTINPVPYYISVAFIHICHHCLKMSSFSQFGEKQILVNRSDLLVIN